MLLSYYLEKNKIKVPLQPTAHLFKNTTHLENCKNVAANRISVQYGL